MDRMPFLTPNKQRQSTEGQGPEGQSTEGQVPQIALWRENEQRRKLRGFNEDNEVSERKPFSLRIHEFYIVDHSYIRNAHPPSMPAQGALSWSICIEIEATRGPRSYKELIILPRIEARNLLNI